MENTGGVLLKWKVKKHIGFCVAMWAQRWAEALLQVCNFKSPDTALLSHFTDYLQTGFYINLPKTFSLRSSTAQKLAMALTDTSRKPILPFFSLLSIPFPLQLILRLYVSHIPQQHCSSLAHKACPAQLFPCNSSREEDR
jgi:hypothetical protein